MRRLANIDKICVTVALSALLVLAASYLLEPLEPLEPTGATGSAATRPQLHPQTTALIVVDRQRYRTPEGGYITVTHYNTGMTCYRSENHHVAFACEGGARRAERPYITPQQREQEREHLRRVRETIHPTGASAPSTSVEEDSASLPRIDKSLQPSK